MWRNPVYSRARTAGFSMVELAVVIVIVSVLLGVVLTPLATRIQMQQVRDQQRTLDELREALLGFAQAYGPCHAGGAPTSAVDELPYATLGVMATDRWGRRYVYAVTTQLTNVVRTGEPAAATPDTDDQLDLTDRGRLTLSERRSDKSLATITTSAAAIVVSLGDNGLGGTDLDGSALPAPSGADELENTDLDASFITRIRTDGGAGCDDTAGTSPLCEFDDLVVMIPTPLLLGRLVQSGRLP
jgi:prepilin-type N-terminal cleavage/methylation domain-containing protein